MFWIFASEEDKVARHASVSLDTLLCRSVRGRRPRQQEARRFQSLSLASLSTQAPRHRTPSKARVREVPVDHHAETCWCGDSTRALSFCAGF